MFLIMPKVKKVNFKKKIAYIENFEGVELVECKIIVNYIVNKQNMITS